MILSNLMSIGKRSVFQLSSISIRILSHSLTPPTRLITYLIKIFLLPKSLTTPPLRPACCRAYDILHLGQTNFWVTFSCIPVQIRFPSLSTSFSPHEAQHFFTRTWYAFTTVSISQFLHLKIFTLPLTKSVTNFLPFSVQTRRDTSLRRPSRPWT